MLGSILALAGAGGLAEDPSEHALAEEFLEFLADWQDERGEWQNPLEYLDPQWQTLDERVGPIDE